MICRNCTVIVGQANNATTLPAVAAPTPNGGTAAPVATTNPAQVAPVTVTPPPPASSASPSPAAEEASPAVLRR